MARTARVVVPNVAHHVVHWAYARDPIFLGDRDYAYYVNNLEECRASLGCKVYAYCIMLNHVHLLVDPGCDPTNLARLMKLLAGRQAQRLKKFDNTGGPVWDGRFRSSPVAENFLLPCARYIELNPLRACLTERPESYRWSSARAKLGLAPAFDFDGAYMALGTTKQERLHTYKEYLAAPIPVEEWRTIRAAVQNADVTGSEQFRSTVSAWLGKDFVRRPRGRPRLERVVTP